MILVLLVVLLVTIFYFKIMKVYSYWTDRGVKQRKQTYLLGDNGGMFLKRESMIDVLLKVYTTFPEERYTGMYQMLLPTLMVKDPELVKRITVKDFEHFVDHRPFVQDEDDPLWSRILVALKGDRWHAVRSTLSPSFTTSKMKVLFSLISESAATFIDYLASIEEETISMELKDTFTRFTNDVIATSAFGIKCNSMTDRENEFFMMGKKATALNGFFTGLKLMALSAAPKLSSALGIKFLDRDVRNFFIRTVTETIRTREKNNITRPDMLHLLLEARKGKNDDEEHHNEVDTGFATVKESKLHRRKATPVELTDLDITAQAMIFFFGGFESISTTMCFMGHELTTHPKMQEKLREEVDETYEECKGELTYEALMRMRYMDMVVSETLRMWPPGPALDRMCVKPYTIEPISGGEKPILLKIGDVVSIPVVGFHRDPKYFPKPEVFDPERFSDENKHKIQPYTYLPFGSGPRNCIGSRFALMEVKALFFYLLSKFELVAVEKTQIPLKPKPGFRLAAENGFWIGLKTRSRC